MLKDLIIYIALFYGGMFFGWFALAILSANDKAKKQEEENKTDSNDKKGG